MRLGLIIKPDTLIYQQNLEVKVLYGKTIHLSDPEIRKNGGKGFVSGSINSKL